MNGAGIDAEQAHFESNANEGAMVVRANWKGNKVLFRADRSRSTRIRSPEKKRIAVEHHLFENSFSFYPIVINFKIAAPSIKRFPETQSCDNR